MLGRHLFAFNDLKKLMAAKKHKRLKSNLLKHKRFCVFCNSLRLNRKSVNYFYAFM